MLPNRVSNPGPLTYESGALPIALRGPAENVKKNSLTSLCRTRYTVYGADMFLFPLFVICNVETKDCDMACNLKKPRFKC